MRKSLIAVVVALLTVGAWGQLPKTQTTTNITANACASITTAGMASVGMVISGSWSGTLQPEFSIGQAGYINATATATASGVNASTITANGGYSSSVSGFDNFELCAQSVTGTATVTLYAVSVSSRLNVGSGSIATIGQFTTDPWFSLSYPSYGVKGNTTPAVTVADAAGTNTSTTLTSPGGGFATAKAGMAIVVDLSVEPAVTSAATVNQSTCTNTAACIPATTPVVTGAGGSMGSASFPVVTYIVYQCVNGGVGGRVSKEYVAQLTKATTNEITVKSLVSTGGSPTCPNGGTQYNTYASIDTVSSLTGAIPAGTVAEPGAASGQEKLCGTTAMGTDLVLTNIATQCTGATLASVTVPSLKTTIQTVNSNTSVTLANALTATIAGAYALYGYDDTAAVQAWLNALQNRVNNTNLGSTGYCPTGNYLIFGPVTTMGSGQLYLRVEGEGKTGSTGLTGPQAQKAGACEFVNGSATADMFQPGNPASANNTGGAFWHVSFRDGIPGLMQATAYPVHCEGCTRMFFLDDAFTGFEHTYGIGLDSISSARYSQFNTFTDLNMNDVWGGIRAYNGLTSDNRYEHGTYYGSQMGGGRAFSFEANGGSSAGGNDFFEYPSIQFFPIHGYFFDRHGVVFKVKGENTANPAGANPIGSGNTGTGVVFDGTANVGGTYTCFSDQFSGSIFAQVQRFALIDSSGTGANCSTMIIEQNSLGSNQHAAIDASQIADNLASGMQISTGATPGAFATVTGAVATAQQLLCVPMGQGWWNSLNQAGWIYAAGTYNLANALNLTFKINLSTASNCTSGVVNLASIATATNPSTGSTNTWNLAIACTATVLDASGALICHGAPGLTIALTNNTTAATVYSDTNTAISSTLDLGQALWLGASVTKSAAGTTSDTITNHVLIAK